MMANGPTPGIMSFFTRAEFIYGVLATLVGFFFAVLWDIWKDSRREAADYRRARALIVEEIETNIGLLQESRKTLVADIDAAKENKQVILALALLPMDAWRATRVAGQFSPLLSDIAKEIGITYHQLAVINQKIQARDLFWASSQALDSYTTQRALINRNLLSNTDEALARLAKHRDALKAISGE